MVLLRSVGTCLVERVNAPEVIVEVHLASSSKLHSGGVDEAAELSLAPLHANTLPSTLRECARRAFKHGSRLSGIARFSKYSSLQGDNGIGAEDNAIRETLKLLQLP